jgi:putative nucleotidyltransferase with HDIG domain
VSEATGYGNLRGVDNTWQIAEAISTIVELRDSFTVRHQWRVVQLAGTLGAEWGLGEFDLKGLRVAALVHDIGKIAIPLEILHKPGKLNRQEFNMIKSHPQVGFNTLQVIAFPWPIPEIVLQHHERLDGSGYPRGLTGRDILTETKILAVANVVEAMISPTPYRAAHSLETALAEISLHRGDFYDPEVVDSCIELFTKQGFEFHYSCYLRV